MSSGQSARWGWKRLRLKQSRYFAAVVLTLILTVCGSCEHSRGRAGRNQSDPANDGRTQKQGQTSTKPGETDNESALRVPQYIVGDAALYDQTAIYAAEILLAEQNVHVLYVPRLMAQADLLCDSIRHASQDLRDLREASAATNPAAVPPTANALAEVKAAYSDTLRLRSVISDGQIGPTYLTLSDSAMQHLVNARSLIGKVAELYGISLPPPQESERKHR